MNRLISLEPSNVVVIRIESGQKFSGQMTLRNVMHTMPVAFRIQPVLKTRYSVKPQSGLIAPLQKVTVEIVYYLPPGETLPETFPNSDDTFLLHSVVVPGADLKPFDSIPADWFTTKKKQVFTDSGIKIMFVGSPILAQLVINGSMDQIREVLEKSDPSWEAADSVDSHGQTLLHLAISQCRPDLVQLILEFGPDLEAQSRSGQSPLEVACGSGEALIVELLLARKANAERAKDSKLGPIHLATQSGHVEVLKLLLLKGSKVNALTRDGFTALHLAAEARRRDCARLLLASGAHVNARDDVAGDTPLHVAAMIGDENMVKLLLQKGANKDVRNHCGRTAYDVAAENGHSRLFDVLRLGDSLCSAARKGEVRAIVRLLENGAVVNGKDQTGWTPLHRASFKGWLEAARALLERGAEVNVKDDDGYTPLHCAAESGHVDVVELLVKRGADVDTRTTKGATAVQIADSLGYIGVARVLVVDRRADVSRSTLEVFHEKSKKKVRGRVVRRGGSGGFGKSMALAVI